MDAVELARQIAADLHTKLAEKGGNPTRPYEFACAEASRRGIDVERTMPSAKMLNSGRASYLADQALILHENTGNEFDDAFLVAHEIGHDALGDNLVEGQVREIDPGRLCEETATSPERVVDYGKRQRREVQMDLFAREFLMPRSVVRKMYLQEGMSAASIAECFHAPFDVVAQQLLDALLLPAIVPTAATPQVERPLNTRQAEAAAVRGTAYLLEAGPGTGKTQTLVGRVSSLLQDNINPRNILLLTFSNKAAAEMSDRISSRDKHAAAAMWIGTFHAFGLDIIRRFHTELGLPEDPRMMDRPEAVELLEDEFPRFGLRHYRDLYDPTDIISGLLAAISRAKDEVVDADGYAALAAQMLEQATTPEGKELAERAVEAARVYHSYENLKRSQHRVDFGDLVSLPVRLLESNSEIRAQLRNQYQHVLVDEYQDVNRSSVRLLEALCGAGENLWVVGDARQAIYRFRGASAFNISRFGSEDFRGAHRGRLQQNYRSSTEIVSAYSTFGARMEVSSGSSEPLVADRGVSGVGPALHRFTSKGAQSIGLADSIERMRSDGFAYRDQAVLCTGNDRMADIGRDLERQGVPVLFLGSLFERPEVKDIFSLLSLLVDRRAVGIVRAISWLGLSISLSDVVLILDYLRDTDTAPCKWMHDVGQIPGLSQNAKIAVERLASILEGFSEDANPWSVMTRVILDRTNFAASIANSDNVAERARGIAVWQTMSFLHAQPPGAGLPISRVLNRVRRLLRLGDDRELRQLPLAAQGLDAVRLMTVHAAKGLEFNVVHLPGCNADTIPGRFRPPACLPPDGMIGPASTPARSLLESSHKAEQECIFYVALSRARDRLILSTITRAGTRARSPSPFLDAMGGGLSRRDVVPQRELPPELEEHPLQLQVEGVLRFSGDQVALFDRCPRRFLYTHVLRIGGRRIATPFLRMHDAVRDVLKKVLTGAVTLSDRETMAAELESAFEANGLSAHGYAAEFRSYALPMLEFIREVRAEHRVEDNLPMLLAIAGGEVCCHPDELITSNDGKRRVRRFRTGRKSSDSEDLGAASLLLATQENHHDAIVETIHLTDQEVSLVSFSAAQLTNRRQQLAEILAEIHAGRFPAKASQRTCPNCPAFFVCGPVPQGPLKRNFAEIYRS